MTTKDIRHTAVAWLERRHRPDWSAEDQAALTHWLSETGHMVAYLRAEAGWHRTDRLSALRQPQPQNISHPMHSEKYRAQNNFWPMLRKAVASLALISLIGAVAYQQWDAPRDQTYVTAIGGHKIITFKDGTRIELNTNTTLRVSHHNERKVWLDKGEAYFEVEHNPSNPFIVIANGRKVTDLGTKFIVRQDMVVRQDMNERNAQLSVAVIEGLVEVAAKDQKPQSLLRPGDILTATGQHQSITQKPLRAILAALDWKNGKLFLDNATLAEAVAEFNRYNTTKLVIQDQNLAQLSITGTFQIRNLETFTSLTKDIFGLKAEAKNNQIILTR